MPIDFGYAPPERHVKGQPNKWLDDLDALVPRLRPRFRSLWMTDHLFWGDLPMAEAWTAMAFLAARFPQMEIGPMVMGQSYRNPALLAKMAATLQHLSRGRFMLGVGAGWKEDEYRAYGYPYPSPGIRIEQLEDTLEIIKRMWTQPGPVSYTGKHYSISNAYCEPPPDPIPPLIVGGGGNKTMKLAARFADWWNISDSPYEKYRERVTILHQHCESIGRDPASLRLTWFGRLSVGRDMAEAVGRSGGQWTTENAFVGTPAQVIEQMQPLVELGVDYFMLDVLDIIDPEVHATVETEVLAKL